MSTTDAPVAGELVQPNELECGEYITFTDTATNETQQAFFICMLEASNNSFICIGEARGKMMGRGYVGRGQVVRLFVKDHPEFLQTQERLRLLYLY